LPSSEKILVTSFWALARKRWCCNVHALHLKPTKICFYSKLFEPLIVNIPTPRRCAAGASREHNNGVRNGWQMSKTMHNLPSSKLT
jgi:hypothetical protein